MSKQTHRDLDLSAADGIAYVLDDCYVDPVLGLVLPGLGDVLGSMAGLSIVAIAWRRGLPRVLVARMLLNLSIDAAVGALPLVGDAFDLAFRAHRRNAALLRSRATAGPQPFRDGLVLAGACLLFLLALALPLVLGVWVLSAGWSYARSHGWF